MEQLLSAIFMLAFFSSMAQIPDSLPVSALMISYNGRSTNPDAIQIEYDKRGNVTSKILVSQFMEDGLGAPIIIREQYDSLDRIIRSESYAFSYIKDNEQLEMSDTASATMDTMMIIYEYTDSSSVESMKYTAISDGYVDLIEKVTYSLLDSLGREVYMHRITPNQIKVRELYKEYESDIIVTKEILRHDSGKIYRNKLNTLFLDPLGNGYKRRLYDDDSALKYKTWSKCGNCEHLYFRNDSGKIHKVIWQDFNGTKWKETNYEYEYGNNGSKKSIKQSSILYAESTKRYSSEEELWKYDDFGNMTYYELVRGNRKRRWIKFLITYTQRQGSTKD